MQDLPKRRGTRLGDVSEDPKHEDARFELRVKTPCRWAGRDRREGGERETVAP